MQQLRIRNSVVIFSLISAGCGLLLAQAPQPSRVPDGGTRERLVSIFIPSLTDSPFTATVNTEWVRVLGDGSRITLHNHRLIARDSRGRIFQERRALVPEGVLESVITQTEITDPSTREQYICRPQELVCQVEVWFPMTAGQMASQQAGAMALGTKLMAGVETVGTRETGVVQAGAIGNNSPIRTMMEYWFSRQLGLNMLSIREDPRFGTQRFELSNVVIGEPDGKLFAPPAGSKVINLKGDAK